jgi:predicted metalloprotease with PDZ domain
LIRYDVTPADPAGHRFEVELTVPAPDPSGQVLRLPSWIPGSYMIREFARHLRDVTARDADGPVALTKVDKDTWRAGPTRGPLVVRYAVYAWDLSVRAAHLDRTHGFFNGTSLFLAVVGHENGPHALTLHPPVGVDGWQVATTLPRTSGDPLGFGSFEAQDYDALIDHPVEMGTFQYATFDAAGVPHAVAITGRAPVDLARLTTDLQAICEAQIRFFGEGRPPESPAPFARYLFLVMAVGDGYGGLEHRDSTALVCKRTDLPSPDWRPGTPPPEDYRGFLGLCSHEYFHSWNVKRMKPAGFVPYTLSREGYTRMLWAYEGITSWYDDLFLLRSRRIDRDGWLELLGRTATQVMRSQGRDHETLEEASFDAWTKYYRQDEDFSNSHVSYYTQGALAAMTLDLALRDLTADAVGLDAFLRAQWTRYGDGRGVPEGALEALAVELAAPHHPEADSRLAAVFDRVLRGTGALLLPDLLASVGLRWNTRASTGDKDKGGKPAAASPDLPEIPGDLGARVGAGNKLDAVREGGPAWRAGLSAGDVVIAVDGLKAGDLTTRLRARPAGARVRLHAFRRDELFEAEVTLDAALATTVWIDVDPAATPAQRARLDAWLSGTATAPAKDAAGALELTDSARLG